MKERIRKWLLKPAEEAAISAQLHYTVVIYDDDDKPKERWPQSRSVKVNYLDVEFRDEFGLFHRFSGITYAVHEEPTI